MAKTSGGVRGGNPKSNLQKSLEKSERSIRNNSYESAIVLDSKGHVILSKKGDSRSVSFNDKDVKLMKNSILTHNHPVGVGKRGVMSIGQSFSHQDLILAVRADAMEMRAVTPTYTFSMKRPKGGWGVSESTLMAAHTKASRIVKKELDSYLNKVGHNQTSYDRANITYWHRVNRIVAKEFGWNYSKRKG